MYVFPSPRAVIIMRRRMLLSGFLLLAAGCSGPGDGEVVRFQGSEVSPSLSPPPGAGAHPAPASDPDADTRGAVVFLGTSLTEGLGLASQDEAWPALIQRRIDSAGLPFRTVNAGVSGDTSAGGLARLDWVLRQPLQVLVVELGANDGLRGLDPEALRKNLLAVVDRTQSRYPEAVVVLVEMEAPTNLGTRYTEAFRSAFREVAELRGLPLIPFLLEGIAGVRSLNQSDGIHPTARGQERMAERAWMVLEPLLRELAS